MAVVRNLIIRLGADTSIMTAELKKAEKALANSKKEMNKQLDGLKGAFKTIGLGVAGAVAGFTGLSVSTGREFEKSIAKVSTIADTAKVSISKFKEDIIKLSNDIGTPANEISDAIYELISSGVSTGDAMKSVEIAMKAAKGGFTDTTTAVDGLTSVMNAYGIKGTASMQKVADEMLVAQNFGKTTFGELSQYIGEVVPIASTLGIKTEELFASLATLTNQGIKTSAATTGLKAAFSNIIKPSLEASEMAKSLGIEFNITALRSKGLAGFLKDIKQKTGGNTEKMGQLFGSVEALNSILALTSDNGAKDLNNALVSMKNGAGSVEKAFTTMQNTTDEKIKKMINKIQNLALKFYDKLAPSIDKLIEKIDKIDFEPFIKGLGWVIDNAELIVIAVGSIATAIGIVKTALFIQSAVDVFKAGMAAVTASAATTSASVSGSAAVANASLLPLLGSIAILAAIGTITIGIALWGVSEAQKAVDELKGSLDRLGNVRDKVSQELQKAYKDRAELKKKGIDTSKPSAGYAQGIDAYIAGLERAFQATNTTDIKAPQWDWFALPKMIGSAFVDTPKYASGGVAYKPHLAVVGDNLNARNDPEIISPVSQIESILNKILPNQNSTTVLEIDGVQFGKIVQSTGQRFYKIQGNPRLT